MGWWLLLYDIHTYRYFDIYILVHLFISLSIYLFIHHVMCMHKYLSIYLSIYLYIYIYIFVYMYTLKYRNLLNWDNFRWFWPANWDAPWNMDVMPTRKHIYWWEIGWWWSKIIWEWWSCTLLCMAVESSCHFCRLSFTLNHVEVLIIQYHTQNGLVQTGTQLIKLH